MKSSRWQTAGKAGREKYKRRANRRRWRIERSKFVIGFHFNDVGFAAIFASLAFDGTNKSL